MKAAVCVCLALVCTWIVGSDAACCSGATCDCCVNLPFKLNNAGCYKSSFTGSGYKMKVTFLGATVIDEILGFGDNPTENCVKQSAAGTGYKACVYYTNWGWNGNTPTGCIKMEITGKVLGIRKRKKDTITCF